MSATEAGTTLLVGAAMPANGPLRAGDQTSIPRAPGITPADAARARRTTKPAGSEIKPSGYLQTRHASKRGPDEPKARSRADIRVLPPVRAAACYAGVG
jgi:hypothetical protein